MQNIVFIHLHFIEEYSNKVFCPFMIYYVKINWRTSRNKSVLSHYLGKLWFSCGENRAADASSASNITGNRLEKLWQINYRCQNIMWIKLLFLRRLIATVIYETVTRSNYCNLSGCLQNAAHGYTFWAEWHYSAGYPRVGGRPVWL